MEKPMKRKELIRVLGNSLIECDQKWLTPLSESIAQTLVMEFASLEDATRSFQFQLGRGGCTFFSDRLLIEQKTTRLSIKFVREGLSLEAEGMVRWVDENTAQTGLSFDYLSPDCREWVIGAIRDGSQRSFIPRDHACS